MFSVPEIHEWLRQCKWHPDIEFMTPNKQISDSMYVFGIHKCACDTSHVPAIPEWWCAGSCLRSPPPQCNPGKRQPSTPACWPGPEWCHAGRRFYCLPVWCGSGHPYHSALPSGFGRSLWRTLSWKRRKEELYDIKQLTAKVIMRTIFIIFTLD